MDSPNNVEGTQRLKIEEVLLREGKYVGPTVGISMLPMLKQRRDTIVVRPKTEKLKPLDVALYRRGNDYVLHRVIYPTETGYVIRGDNCYADEIVPEEDVFGVLTEFFHNDRHVLCTDENYLRYARRIVKNYPRRRFWMRLKQKIKNAVKSVLKFFGWKRKK